jgi:hypothetical protein
MKFIYHMTLQKGFKIEQNTDILEELKVTPIQDNISNYETDWRYHVNRMSRSRLTPWF